MHAQTANIQTPPSHPPVPIPDRLFFARVSIKGLDTFSEGTPLSLQVTPAGGGAPFDIQVNHTFNAEQIDWFKAGSALNLMKTNNAAA